MNRLARGDALTSLASWLAGAALIEFEKPEEGLRPIAVGEILRRLIGKCLCDSPKIISNNILSPLQIGISVPQDYDFGIYTVRQ